MSRGGVEVEAVRNCSNSNAISYNRTMTRACVEAKSVRSCSNNNATGYNRSRTETRTSGLMACLSAFVAGYLSSRRSLAMMPTSATTIAPSPIAMRVLGASDV